MMNILLTIITNKMFYLPALAWLVAQCLKALLIFLKKREKNKWFLIELGGMPSAHATYVSSFSTLLGLELGWDSPIFLTALCFSIVVIADAAGFRRATGKQARTLNEIIEKIQKIQSLRDVKPETVRELLGHTPLEVFVGVILGVGVSLLLYR
jgi:hypothetical protein